MAFSEIFAKETPQGTPINGLIITSLLITCLLFLTLDKGLIKQFQFITLLAHSLADSLFFHHDG